MNACVIPDQKECAAAALAAERVGIDAVRTLGANASAMLDQCVAPTGIRNRASIVLCDLRLMWVKAGAQTSARENRRQALQRWARSGSSDSTLATTASASASLSSAAANVASTAPLQICALAATSITSNVNAPP